MKWRWRGAVRAAAVVVAVAACGPGPSELVVHNRTSVPIVIAPMYQYTYTLQPCATLAFTYNGDWVPATADQPSLAPVEAVPVQFKVIPNIENSIGHVEAIVSDSGASIYYPGQSVPPLPPCQGIPPSPSPSPSR
jgi:hypothetical protein